jgi:hypothetical protein
VCSTWVDVVIWLCAGAVYTAVADAVLVKARLHANGLLTCCAKSDSPLFESRCFDAWFAVRAIRQHGSARTSYFNVGWHRGDSLSQGVANDTEAIVQVLGLERWALGLLCAMSASDALGRGCEIDPDRMRDE